MKMSSQGSCSASLEEKQKTNDNRSKHADLPNASHEDIPSPWDPKDSSEKDSAGPNEVLAWVADASKFFATKFGPICIEELEGMASLYLSKVSSCISKCYVPNRAAKMKRYMNDVLIFFNSRYRKIPEENKVYSSYLDKMTELMAYYIDMEIQASSRAKEHPLVVAHKVTASLFIFLDKSPDHILDAILKANMNRKFWELCSLIFSGVLKETPNRTLSELTYVRYILVYKMWKRVVQGPEDRKNVVTLASLRLKHPPNFVEQIRAGLLNGIIPRISKKRADVTMFLIQAKFDVKEKAKAFLKYVDQSNTNIMFVPTVPALKTDIPLLVGHLPDFGPAPNLIKLEPPTLEENDPRNVDLTCSRLMNEIWTSVNHEASFREAIRMQNVTTYNREEALVPERKKVLRVLKQRKGKVKNTKSTEHEAVNKQRDDTIVLSDDSDKGGFGKEHPIVIPNPKSKSKRDLFESPQIHKREPTPPPKVVSPPPKQVSSLPTPQDYILTPSQIKQEIIIDDDEVMEVKQIVEEAINREDVPGVEAKDEHDSDLEAGGVASELKEEEDAVTKEKEYIRINRDLISQIKCSESECERDQDATSSSAKDAAADIGSSERPENIFDDETSWSPPCENQEFFRNVVDTFISEYLPGDDDNRARNGVECSLPSSSESHRPDGATTDQGEERKTGGRSALECHQEEAPSPKRARIEESVFNCERAAESPSRSETVELDGHSLPEHDESLLCGVVHNETLLRDRNLFLSQAKFRDMLTRTGCIDMEVPSPDQVDPETGSIAERCCCPQCKGNNDALQANYRALVEYLASMERARESPVPEGSIDADLGGADPEPNPQLPFKKRKAFCGSEERRDDSESQHSDGSKDEEGKNWAEEPTHSGVLSIADVGESERPGECATPPPPEPGSYEPQLPADNYSSNPSTPAGISSLYSGVSVMETSGQKSAGGGFPPFSAVIPASTSYASQCSDPQTSTRRRRREESDDRPRFRTPAELKEIVQAENASSSPSPVHPWTRDLVNVAYFTRKLNNNSSSIATTPDRCNVESTSERRGRRREPTSSWTSRKSKSKRR